MAQFGRPDSDVSAGSWTANGGPSSLYDCLNEITPSDSDYCEEAGGTSLFEVGLTNVDDPLSSADHVVRWRWYSTGSGAKEKMTIRLLEGATVRATCVLEANVDRAWTAKSYTLSAGEADSIGDYTDLRIDFQVTQQGGSEACQISWAELEVPDASLPPVNKDLAAQWDILNLVNKDLAAQYDLLNLVNKDLAAPFDIFNLVNKDLQSLWDIRELVNKDLQGVWDMEGAVSKDLAAQYDIQELVNKDLQTLWDIFILVNKDLEGQWDILNLVNKDLEVQFDIAGLVGNNLQVVYDIFGEAVEAKKRRGNFPFYYF